MKYGYISVGRVEAGPSAFLGRNVFCLYPHQSRYVVPAAAVHLLPETVAPERAVLAANLETAVNGLWDAAPRLGDRIAVIGKNGKGKTTLLNLLARELSPTSGDVTHHANLRLAIFGQTNINRLDPGKTTLEEIMAAHPDTTRASARSIAGLMMFEGDHALKKVNVLSGGERSRVLLGKLLVSPANLLLLDEPSNHLDMESVDALLEAVDAFDGAVIIVTHSEMILHAVATRLVVFDNGAVGSVRWAVSPALHIWPPSFDFADWRWLRPVPEYDLFLFLA